MDNEQLHSNINFSIDSDLYGANNVDHDVNTPTDGPLPFIDIGYPLGYQHGVGGQAHNLAFQALLKLLFKKRISI